MTNLSEALDLVGWSEFESLTFDRNVFAWMEKANAEIVALRRELNYLNDKVEMLINGEIDLTPKG